MKDEQKNSASHGALFFCVSNDETEFISDFLAGEYEDAAN